MKEFKVEMAEGQKTLIVREGKAPEIRENNVLHISGDINTVKNYVEKRYLKADPLTPQQRLDNEAAGLPYNMQQFYKETAVVTFDAANLSIELKTNPQDYFGTTVTGTLEVSDELKPFAINTDRTFNREQLVKLIRFNKRFFSDAAKHDDVLKAYQSLNLTGSTQLKAESDNRGNKAAEFKKVIDSSNIPTVFFLTMPIYKGLPPVKFAVEVCLDNSESSVIFWFESVELKELMDKTRDIIFDEQKKLFSDFVVVNK